MVKGKSHEVILREDKEEENYEYSMVPDTNNNTTNNTVIIGEQDKWDTEIGIARSKFCTYFEKMGYPPLRSTYHLAFEDLYEKRK
jgi:hypothetical protein